MRSVSLPLAELSVPLARDGFFRAVLRELAGSLEDIVGLDQAEGFVSVVGQRIGDDLDATYRTALDTPQLDRSQVAAVLVDLKARLDGAFEVVEESETRLVFENSRCPFGEAVLARPALCMMTSNVFGRIAASNLGYARVLLERTIANGDGMCRVVVELQPSAQEGSLIGREYFAR